MDEKRMSVAKMQKAIKKKGNWWMCFYIFELLGVCVCLMEVMASKEFVVRFVWIMFKDSGGSRTLKFALCEWWSFGYGRISERIDVCFVWMMVFWLWQDWRKDWCLLCASDGLLAMARLAKGLMFALCEWWSFGYGRIGERIDVCFVWVMVFWLWQDWGKDWCWNPKREHTHEGQDKRQSVHE
jgi:hypothetical protein